jgi:DNA adenine methylase
MSRPFLKWAGGKRGQAETIEALMPREFGRYFEPFLGGGAVFFHLANAGRKVHQGSVVLSDLNVELVNTWNMVKDHTEELVNSLELLRLAYDKAPETTFYKVRAQEPRDLVPIDRAARVIFLNKTCFNGLWRTNSRGEFNTPWNRSEKSVGIVDAENLYAASRSLSMVSSVRARDFADIEAEVVKGDVVYFDPPYLPLPGSKSFASYQPNGFNLGEHQRLALLFRRLSGRGVFCVLSNADVPLARELYAGFRIVEVRARRSINSAGGGRSEVGEILIVGEKK